MKLPPNNQSFFGVEQMVTMICDETPKDNDWFNQLTFGVERIKIFRDEASEGNG